MDDYTALSDYSFDDFTVSGNCQEKQKNKEITDAVVQRCSVKKLFEEISQNPHENNCARVSFLEFLVSFLLKNIPKIIHF